MCVVIVEVGCGKSSSPDGSSPGWSKDHHYLPLHCCSNNLKLQPDNMGEHEYSTQWMEFRTAIPCTTEDRRLSISPVALL